MEKYFIATITAANHIGSKSVQKLVNFFGSAENVWNAEVIELKNCGLQKKAVESFLQFRNKFPDAPKNLQEFCAKKNIGLCSFVDDDYPPLLKEISTPPAIIYYRGNFQPFAERIAIVGTREFTTYGKNVAIEIAEELAAAGITIVSGAARGIDTFAHTGAMKTGRTVAVLGCGINFRESIEKQKFLEKIIDSGGLVMTEFDPNFPPQAGTFPARNRIIAGLSKGVVVVEAGEKSGALLTTNDAADFGRDVFAVPNSIYAEKSKGCHALIQDGGILIKGAKDIFDFYKLTAKNTAENVFAGVEKKNSKKITNSPPVVLDEIEKKVLNLIPFDETITVDEILMQEEELEPNEISEILLRLEVKKVVQEDSGNYTRVN